MTTGFTNRLVRELDWCLRPGHLLTGSVLKYNLLPEPSWQQKFYELHSVWLRTLDKNPQLLETHLKAKGHQVLGKRFEALIEFCLQESPHIKLLAHNVQLSDPQRTVGEIDFVFEDWNGDLILMETAIKFYLLHKEGNPTGWIGPNARDRLSNKLTKVSDYQLNLDFHPLREFLKQFDRPVKPLFYLKGMTFQHGYGIQGFSKLSELERGMFIDKFWVILPKKRWIGKLLANYGELPVYEGTKILSRIRELHQETSKSVCYAEVLLEERKIIEVNRRFCVADSWPQH